MLTFGTSEKSGGDIDSLRCTLYNELRFPKQEIPTKTPFAQKKGLERGIMWKRPLKKESEHVDLTVSDR